MGKIIGIYKITSPSNCVYIGQSIDIQKRWWKYKALRCKNQCKLYNSLKKHGVENHKFEIIHHCDEEQLNKLEIYYIQLFQTFNSKHGLNLRDGGGNKGKCSDETKLKLSIINKGKKLSEETKNKIGKASKNRHWSLESRIKLSNSQKGKHFKKIINI